MTSGTRVVTSSTAAGAKTRASGAARLLALAAASVSALALAAGQAAATTLPETTYFVTITLTDSKVTFAPMRTVKPGSLVVFTVRNKGTQSRNLVFGADKTGFIAPGRKQQFELNFIVPWTISGVSVDRDGAHPLTVKFVCSY